MTSTREPGQLACSGKVYGTRVQVGPQGDRGTVRFLGPLPTSCSSVAPAPDAAAGAVWLGIEWDSAERGRQREGRFSLDGEEVVLFQCGFAESSASLLRLSVPASSAAPTSTSQRALLSQLGERRSLLQAVRHRYCDEQVQPPPQGKEERETDQDAVRGVSKVLITLSSDSLYGCLA
jgi:CAP-Gly domain